jgi:hypothetical protein
VVTEIFITKFHDRKLGATIVREIGQKNDLSGIQDKFFPFENLKT